MASLYAEYLEEITDDHILETDKGFATYRFMGETVYVVDIFVLPQFRKDNVATDLADIIGDLARGRGCKEMMGTVRPTNKKSTDSLRVLLGYGMKLSHIAGELIVFRKEL